jgi:hypothetical protein
MLKQGAEVVEVTSHEACAVFRRAWKCDTLEVFYPRGTLCGAIAGTGAGEALDMILMESSRDGLAEGEEGPSVGIVGQVQATFAGLQRFMKQLQN